MRFFRTHAALLLVILMCSLCLFATGIAVRVSLTMLERRDQVVKEPAAGDRQVSEHADQGIKMNKLDQQTMFFNGEKQEGLTAFAGEGGTSYIPLDQVLERLGIPFQYYAPDDILEWKASGTKVRIKLGVQGFWMGSERMNLDSVPTAAKNHILVPLEMFMHLSDFNYSAAGGKDPVFLNYYPGGAKSLGKLTALRQINGTALITDLFGSKITWGRKDKKLEEDIVLPSPNGTGFLLKTDGNSYLYDQTLSRIPQKIQADPLAEWSSNGKFLFWGDDKEELSYIYDIKGKQVKTIGDHYFRIRSGSFSEGGQGDLKLLDYQKGSRYERISFSDASGSADYSRIERRGRIVAEGRLIYSPDGRKAAYEAPNDGYYFINADGTGKTRLGPAKQVLWVNNGRLWMETGSGNNIVTEHGSKIVEDSTEWQVLGQAPGGEVLYSANQVLYMEKAGVESKLRTLPWKADRIYCQSPKGPWIAVSSGKKEIFLLTKTKALQIGKEERDARLEVSYSPDGKNIALLQNENGNLAIRIVNLKESNVRKMVIGYTKDAAPMDGVTLKWVSNTLLLAYSQSQWSAVDIRSGFKLYHWNEGKDSKLYTITSP